MHYAPPHELQDDARPRSDAQFSLQPLSHVAIGVTLKSSLSGLSAAAKDAQQLPLPPAQHRAKVQQMNALQTQ